MSDIIRHIEVRNIYKFYRNSNGGYEYNNESSEEKRFGVFNISANFKKGSFNIILGKSGSGKTTFLKLLSGLSRPDRGEVIYDETLLNTLNYAQLAAFRKDHLGFIFQEVGLLPHLRCFENIEFPELQFDTKKVNELAGYFGIEHCLNKYPSEVSQGERQRITMARALHNNPQILIADEPTANLDWENAKKSIELIKTYADKGTTVFLATHDERILKYGDSMLRLEKGKLKELKAL